MGGSTHQKADVFLCPLVGSARMPPDAHPPLKGTGAEHPNAPRKRRKAHSPRRSQALMGSSHALFHLPTSVRHPVRSDVALKPCKQMILIQTLREGGVGKKKKKNKLVIEGVWRRFNWGQSTGAGCCCHLQRSPQPVACGSGDPGLPPAPAWGADTVWAE